MSMISELLKKLKDSAYVYKAGGYPEASKLFLEAADTIEALSAKLQAENVERSSEDCGGWISCEERLPKDRVKVLVWFEYFRYGEYNRLFQTTGISYTFNGEWSGFVNDTSGWEQLSILAWQPLPVMNKEEKDYGKSIRSK